MESLIKNSNMNILTAEAAAPTGCTVHVLEDSKVFLLVKGIVKMDQEILKLGNKLDKAKKQRDSIISKQALESYNLNVAESIKELDRQKLAGLEAELQSLTLTIEEFEKLK